MTRIACFLVPMFPLAARLRSEPELRQEAVVVTEGNGTAARIVAATRRARKEGIQAGMTLPQARSLLPKLIARGRDAECERTAHEALLDVAETFSPRIEDGGPGIVFLDISGLERHFANAVNQEQPPDGGRRAEARRSIDSRESNASAAPAHENNLAQAALRSVERIGMPVRVGIAASKLASRVAAELPHSPHIVPAGEESSFLAPLPLARLTPQLEAAEMLRRWGIRSIGEFAHLPEGEIAARLGEAGRDLHWSARGIDPTPLVPRQLPPEFREAMDLEWPLVAMEPFLFVANAALDRLAGRMEMHGLACKRLELTLRLEPDGFHSRAIELPAPTRDIKTLLTLIRLDLEASPPGGPIAGFTFVAHPDRPRRAQLSLFGPMALSPDKLATTIARLAALVGPERVGMACTVNGHVPERFNLAPFDPPPPPDTRRRPRKGRGLMAVRTLRPAIPLEVITSQDVDQRLISVRSAPDSPLKIDGRISVAAGPWHLEEGWWSEEPVTRDYWDVEMFGGGMYRVFRDRGCREWFADGVYD